MLPHIITPADNLVTDKNHQKLTFYSKKLWLLPKINDKNEIETTYLNQRTMPLPLCRGWWSFSYSKMSGLLSMMLRRSCSMYDLRDLFSSWSSEFSFLRSAEGDRKVCVYTHTQSQQVRVNNRIELKRINNNCLIFSIGKYWTIVIMFMQATARVYNYNN